MNPTQYLTPKGLRGVIRNPKAVRAWPQMMMPGFDETMLREADLDALIAYLAYMATALIAPNEFSRYPAQFLRSN